MDYGYYQRPIIDVQKAKELRIVASLFIILEQLEELKMLTETRQQARSICVKSM